MKRVRIEPLSCSFYVYGPDEHDRFVRDYKLGDSYKDWHGCTSGNGVWINDNAKDNISTCYHEAVHIVDWILEERLEMVQGKLSDNKELRAYLIDYVGGKIRKHVLGY